jgi:hypothetical protein
MSDKKQSSKQYQNIKCVNTAKGSTDRRGKFTLDLDKDDKPVFTKSLRVTYVSTTDDFEPEAMLQSERLAKWQEAKPQLSLVPNTNYVLVEDSVTDWDATETKPSAVSCTYRPEAVFVE